ncbi:MAG TPA: hypothetical protein VJV79_19665 [Polyangiaceae bacterium]|nr:hypothetical protein [Polyangiaceae bacterium]
MTRLIAVTSCALCLAVGAGCSKSEPAPSIAADSPAKGELKNDPTAQVAVARAKPPAVGAPAAHAGPDCNQVCEPVRKLRCRRASECVDSCRQMAAGEVCRTQLSQFYACLASEPFEHWECMDDGTGAIKDGFCEREQASFAACLEKSDVR